MSALDQLFPERAYFRYIIEKDPKYIREPVIGTSEGIEHLELKNVGLENAVLHEYCHPALQQCVTEETDCGIFNAGEDIPEGTVLYESVPYLRMTFGKGTLKSKRKADGCTMDDVIDIVVLWQQKQHDKFLQVLRETAPLYPRVPDLEMQAMIEDALQEFNLHPTFAAQLLFLTRRLTFNAFAVNHSLNLYLKASLFNHSCSPNASFQINTLKQNTLVVTATKPILRGEEVTINYLGNLAQNFVRGKRARLAVLKERFGFDCKCSFCFKPSEKQTSQ